MKSYEEIMEILEAFDLTGSLRGAAELAGCSHHTVKEWVDKRDMGLLPARGDQTRRPRLVDEFLDKIEEWVDRSNARIRADVVFDKLMAMGFAGSERTVRRAVAEAKQRWRHGQRRVYRPWVTEPGMWAQWDWGAGPSIDGRATSLFCAWLAWSRHRVVIPAWDKTLPTVIGCLDRSMRTWGGCPTYWLTDNERTVTTGHVARIAIRNPQIVAVGAHYGVTVATCVPADPQTKGGSEATVRIAKADLVPTDCNLRDDYATWDELVAGCETFTATVNARVHRVTRRVPDELLTEERQRLHRLPEAAYTVAFGQTRQVSWSSTISFGGVAYSVPHTLAGQQVWARVDGDELAIVHINGRGPLEVARHRLSTPGKPMIRAEHYPPRPEGPLARTPTATNAAEQAFLDIGDGARMWLIEAGAAGASRVKAKMDSAVQLARLHGQRRVDWALGHAACYGRFGDGDVASILAANPPGVRRSADEVHSLQPGTAAWKALGNGNGDGR